MLLSRNFLERSGWNLLVNISQIRSKTTQKSPKNPTKNPEKWPQKWDPLYTKLLNTPGKGCLESTHPSRVTEMRLATCILQAVKGIPLGFLEGPENGASPRVPLDMEVPGTAETSTAAKGRSKTYHSRKMVPWKHVEEFTTWCSRCFFLGWWGRP